MANKPYLIDAIVGNGRMLGSLGRAGRLHRLWWPHIDHPQHVDLIRTGVRLGGERTVWFDEDDGRWERRFSYLPGTNITVAESSLPGFALTVRQHDFALPDKDALVRRYTFTNATDAELSFRFVWHSSMHVNESGLYNTTMFDEANDALVHYHHRSFFAVSGSRDCAKFQCGHAGEAAESGEPNGSEIDMQPDGALLWEFDRLAAGESAEIAVYIAAGADLRESLELLSFVKGESPEHWLRHTASYWREELRRAAPSPEAAPDVVELYERSVLMFKLMADRETGSLLAAPEADERHERCGGYAYCWGRDAAFITTALDRCGLTDASRRFYEWTLRAQEADGSWQQRHYHDGSLAPSWGLQIDEGASILWGMWQHYETTRDEGFARTVWPAVRQGAEYLVSFLDPETGLPSPSIDLWEERNGEHTYSAAAVCGGIRAAASFARLAGDSESASNWETTASGIADAIVRRCWNEADGSFYRGLHLKVDERRFEQALEAGQEGSVAYTSKGYPVYRLKYDRVVDISLLGVSVPFAVLPPEHEYMTRLADTVEERLLSPTVGGIKRYEDDQYAGGNPWILTTLWLAQYRASAGQFEAARRLLRWATEHRTETGLLPEQVDKSTGRPAWIVPLTWSHAMYVLTVRMLADAGQLAEETAARASES
ncbi:glycoside hydrolase family 15 protein [Cohnella hongkongensis]|uniref:Glycoside hydrolase family 15 protein n=1 Tax=Cohnella hongkongensis TaxID=178337 RepID=A0ABV9FIF5_9BACL